jgi:flagellin-like protein
VSRYRRAISPVIATVILVAVTIAISISAAYWMSGTSGQYTGFEKIEIPTAYSTLNPTVNNAKWRIHLSLKNSGPNPAKITYVMLNEAIVTEYNITEGGSLSSISAIGTSMSDNGVFLQSGETMDVYVWIGSGLFSSGTTIAVKLHSTSGFDYVKLVKLS